MHFIYNIAITLLQWLIPISGVMSKKLNLFVKGRKQVFTQLEMQLDKDVPVIWFHAASLGEYEQGVPVMEEIKKRYTDHQLVITFFSPSGYEIKKNNALAKATAYLPLDTPSNARKFLDVVKPDLVFFIKYEFWPNFLTQLYRRKIRTFLLSGVFREKQPFFKSYGRWMIKSLGAFEFFFLQDQSSAEALKKLGFENQIVSGDTRFDRVAHQIEMDNSLDFLTHFKGDALCVVCGSTWLEDEQALTSFINGHQAAAKFVIAPHEIQPLKIQVLQESLKVRVVRFSEKAGKDLAQYDVLILDTIGLLSQAYSYADIAYVGGAMGTTGLHNILEPATFGIPILTGTQLEKFPEALRLRQLAGLYSVKDTIEMKAAFLKLLNDAKFRTQTGMIAGHFINSNTGATKSVMKYLEDVS